MRLAQISSRVANLAWGQREMKAKLLSDALGCQISWVLVQVKRRYLLQAVF